MDFSSKALILRVGRFKERDIWVRFLSASRGIVTAFAFGGSCSKRRFSGCLDVCNLVYFHVQTTRNGQFLALQEGTLLRGPENLRTDWQKYGMLMNCFKYVEAFGVTPEDASVVFDLTVDLFDFFEKSPIVHPLIPIFFRMRLALEQGYAIQLHTCSVCSCSLAEHQSLRFYVQQGVLVCPDCGQLPGYSLRLSAEALQAWIAVQTISPLQWAEIELTADVNRELARVFDAFVEHHVGIHWENGRFIRK